MACVLALETRYSEKLSAETKRIFAAKQKECGIRFSIVYPMRLLIHKVQSRFATWVAEFLNHACVMWIRMHQVFFCGYDAETPFLVQVAPKILVEISQIWYNFFPICSQHISCSCFRTALECNRSLKSFSRN